MSRCLAAVAVTAVTALAACSSPDPEDTPCVGDTFVPGMSATGAAGARITIVSADPAPPARFINTWTIRASDATGTDLPATAVTLATFMPEHGHAGRAATVSPGPDATLVVTPIDLWMPGLWELTFTVTAAAGRDAIRFAFCVPE